MNVIGPMAVHAGFRRVMESIGVMAACADGILMLPQQREPCKPVIESYRGSPAILTVAVGTPWTELTDMRVIVLVTRSAFAIDGLADRARVTGCACERDMRPAERKITNEIVIETGVRPA